MKIQCLENLGDVKQHYNLNQNICALSMQNPNYTALNKNNSVLTFDRSDRNIPLYSGGHNLATSKQSDSVLTFVAENNHHNKSLSD